MSFIRSIFMCASALIPLVGFTQFKKVIVEEVENEGRVPGRTYRIYAELTNEKDQVFVVFGDSIHHLDIHSSTKFFQHKNGSATTKNIARNELAKHDSLRYDSWITIGAVDNYENNINLLNLNLDDFEKKGGAIKSTKDGAWFCIPTDKQAYCKTDKKILLMQLTTTGKIDGKFSIMGKTKDGTPYTNYDVTFECGKGKH